MHVKVVCVLFLCGLLNAADDTRPLIKALTPFPGIGIAATQGRRPAMEDYVCCRLLVPHVVACAVYDGHGGDLAAQYAQQQLLYRVSQDLEKDLCNKSCMSAFGVAFQSVEADLLKEEERSGTAAVIAAVNAKKRCLSIANLGDSRLVVGYVKDKSLNAKQLTRDHKPDDPNEEKRILAAGDAVCRVFYSARGEMLVAGQELSPGNKVPARVGNSYGLGVARALGDFSYKNAFSSLVAIPECSEVPFDTAIDKYAILGSDGLWDVVSNEQAVSIVDQQVHACPPEVAPGKAAVALVHQAYEQSSRDNITAIVMVLSMLCKKIG